MSARTRLAMRIWYVGVAVIVLAALALQFVLTVTGGVDANSGESGAGVPVGERLINSYSFFTVDSNILVLIVAILLVAEPVRTGTAARVLHLTALVSIAITGIVFSFVLAPGLELTPAAELVTVCFHYLTPALFVLGWALFGPRPQFSARLLLFVFLWPAAWLAYTFVRGAVTGWYPYPFLNADVLGLVSASRNASVVVLLALVVAGIIVVIDRFVPAIGGRRRSPGV